jgi:hypothetical protein
VEIGTKPDLEDFGVSVDVLEESVIKCCNHNDYGVHYSPDLVPIVFRILSKHEIIWVLIRVVRCYHFFLLESRDRCPTEAKRIFLEVLRRSSRAIVFSKEFSKVKLLLQ